MTIERENERYIPTFNSEEESCEKKGERKKEREEEREDEQTVINY